LVKAKREETAALEGVLEAAVVPVPVPVPVPVALMLVAVTVKAELTPETGVKEVTGSELTAEDSVVPVVPVADAVVEPEPVLEEVALIGNGPDTDKTSVMFEMLIASMV